MRVSPGHPPIDPQIGTLPLRSYSRPRDHAPAGDVGGFSVVMFILAFMGYAVFASLVATF